MTRYLKVGLRELTDDEIADLVILVERFLVDRGLFEYIGVEEA